jgi:ubiquinone/menaquinone biosynthesis C-methylase UbiE
VSAVPPDRDVPDRDISAFEERAAHYDEGRLGVWHHQVSDRTAALARSVSPAPGRVLDVGCGTGYLLRVLAAQWPQAGELVGLDAARAMIEAAAASADDPRLRFCLGTAERLPFPDRSFDLVVTTTSFDHWSDQQAGLCECARVLEPGGRFVLVDLFSPLFIPTLVGARRGKARTRSRARKLLSAAGFSSLAWHDVDTMIKAVTATR